MRIDDAIEIKKPQPDNQFRLMACRCCNSENAVFVKILCGDGVERWNTECADCGYGPAGYSETLHDAQMVWNRVMGQRAKGDNQ